MTRSKRSQYPTMQIVEGICEGKKVRQKIIASLGVVRDEKDKKRFDRLAENFIQKFQKEGSTQAKQWLKIENVIHREIVYDGFGITVERLLELTEINFGKSTHSMVALNLQHKNTLN